MKVFDRQTVSPRLLHGRAVVLDMDGTIIHGDIGETLFYHLLMQESLNPGCIVDYFEPIQAEKIKTPMLLSEASSELLLHYRTKLKAGAFQQAYLDTARWLGKFNQKSLAHLAKAFLDEGIAPKRIRCKVRLDGSLEDDCNIYYGAHIKPVMHALLDYFQEQGARLWIVSASPQGMCEVVAEKLGIPLSRVLGVKIATNENEPERMPWGIAKTMALKEAGVTHPLIVLGDSAGDREMLSIADYPVVVQNEHNKLVTFAQEQGWWFYRAGSDELRK